MVMFVLQQFNFQAKIHFEGLYILETARIGNKHAQRPLLCLSRQLVQEKVSSRELGRELTRFNRDVDLTKPAVEGETLRALIAVA